MVLVEQPRARATSRRRRSLSPGVAIESTDTLSRSENSSDFADDVGSGLGPRATRSLVVMADKHAAAWLSEHVTSRFDSVVAHRIARNFLRQKRPTALVPHDRYRSMCGGDGEQESSTARRSRGDHARAPLDRPVLDLDRTPPVRPARTSEAGAARGPRPLHRGRHAAAPRASAPLRFDGPRASCS